MEKNFKSLFSSPIPENIHLKNKKLTLFNLNNNFIISSFCE